jgi:hypothetical protein
VKFRARENPFKNTDTAESIQKVMDLEARDPKRPILNQYLRQLYYENPRMPETFFDMDPD